MPAERKTTRHRNRRSNDPNYESHVQDTLARIRAGEFKSFREKEKQKEAETAERAHRVADDALNRNFTGRLASYKKDDLRALAIALSISDKGTNGELSSRIEDCFKMHPDLQNNLRFSGLFNRSSGRRKTAQENLEGSLSQHEPQSHTTAAPAQGVGSTSYHATSQIHTSAVGHFPNLSAPYHHLYPPLNPYNTSNIPLPYPSPGPSHSNSALMPPHQPFQYYIPHLSHFNPPH